MPRHLCKGTLKDCHAESDPEMADIFDKYKGEKIIRGGTTAKIIAGELNRKITGDGDPQEPYTTP